jgi:hypothetical protein
MTISWLALSKQAPRGAQRPPPLPLATAKMASLTIQGAILHVRTLPTIPAVSGMQDLVRHRLVCPAAVVTPA